MAEIENTYAEAFDGLYCRIIITAKDETRLKRAAYGCTASPMVVAGRTEGGVERWLNPRQTLDKRLGALVQFWGAIDESKPLEASLKKFIKEVSYRIRQEILVEPTTCVFNALDSDKQIDTMDPVGHWRDCAECSAGSKPKTNYPEIGPTTNHPCCPSLRGETPNSKVPDGVTSIPEIVITGV